MRIVSASNRRAVAELLSATRIRDRATEKAAAQIVDRVRRRGDAAVKQFATQFDGLTGSIEVPQEKWEREARALDPRIRRAIARAARNIRSVSRKQVPK